MANLDTRDKRGSALGIGLAFLRVLPDPDGAITQPDRQQVALTYSAIAAGVVVVPTIDPTLGLDGYLGRYQAGQDVPLSVVAPGAEGGTFRAYGGGVLVAAGVLAGETDPDLPDRLSGHLAVGRGMVPGPYQVVYHYDGDAPTHAARLATFEVSAGGDAAGSVVAGLVLRAAEGDAALVQLRAGYLATARVPYLDEGVE